MKKFLCLILMVLLFAGTPISAQRSKTRKKARQEQTIKTPTPKWAAGTTTKQKKVLRELRQGRQKVG